MMTNKTFEIKVDDYLTEDEIKDIVIYEVRSSVKSRNEENLTRIIKNASHYWFRDIVSEVMGENFNEKIEEQVKEILSKVSEYTVIRDGSYGGNQSKAYLLIQEYVEKHKSILEDKVKEKLENLSEFDILRYEGREEIADSVSQAIYDVMMRGVAHDNE